MPHVSPQAFPVLILLALAIAVALILSSIAVILLVRRAPLIEDDPDPDFRSDSDDSQDRHDRSDSTSAQAGGHSSRQHG